ncbi:hypothetical protein [Maliponia aquimaris]|uniref:5-bromo-4-chloroindolyl phosphate hydrolysis protein n=1 Tax=Maliponia aquimaris TaxID=1673631 RepID=A0A238K9D2_9RHOB|nr:hypothetical protein [Maliponia aquimaris]SMX39024.1 hypothetical protein MAA8898_01841 [Maliponia aquimaris]
MADRRRQNRKRDENEPEGIALERAQLDTGLNFMFLSAFPLLLWVFQDSFAGIATAVALLWVLSLALRLVSVGQQIHFDYDQAEIARAPRLPRKLVGSVLIALVVVVLAGHKYDSLWLPAVAGVVALGLSLAAFGLDPRHDKGTDRAQERAFMETIESALFGLADRVAALDDAVLTLRAEAARTLILRPLRQSAGNPERLARLDRPLRKIVTLLDSEVTRLELAWNGQGHDFARRRFLAKLEVLTESYEAFARHSGIRGARDAFERQADLLLDRMPRESAA